MWPSTPSASTLTPAPAAAFGVPFGPTVDPQLLLPVALATLAGCLLGSCSGLGAAANNFALLLAGASPHVAVDPLVLGAAMLAAGVVHTFLDIVPSLALGSGAAVAVAVLALMLATEPSYTAPHGGPQRHECVVDGAGRGRAWPLRRRLDRGRRARAAVRCARPA